MTAEESDLIAVFDLRGVGIIVITDDIHPIRKPLDAGNSDVIGNGLGKCSDDLDLRQCFTQRLRAFLHEIHIIFRNPDPPEFLFQIRINRAAEMTPEYVKVRFIPDFIMPHTTGEMLSHCGQIIFPGSHCPGTVIKRDLADIAAHHPIGRKISALPELLLISGYRRMDRVTESGTEPGLNPAPKQIVHNGIKPGEIINARCLFTFDPAGLQPYPFTAGGAEGIVKGRRVIGVAIKRFHADSHDGTGDIMTGEGFQRSERTDAELLIQRRRIVVIQIQVI